MSFDLKKFNDEALTGITSAIVALSRRRRWRSPRSYEAVLDQLREEWATRDGGDEKFTRAIGDAVIAERMVKR